MSKRKRGSRRGARGKVVLINRGADEIDSEPDCVGEEEEEQPASSSQGPSCSQIEISKNDFLKDQKIKQTDITVVQTVTNKAPKLRRTSARVFGKISLEDAFSKTSDTAILLGTNVSSLPTKCEGSLLKENDVDKVCIANDKKSTLIDLNSEANLKNVISPANNEQSLNIKYSMVNYNEAFLESFATKYSDVLKETITDNSFEKNINKKISNEQNNAIDSVPSKSKVPVDSSEVEVIFEDINNDKKLNDNISESYKADVFEEEDEEELIYEDLNDQGTEKDNPINIDDDERLMEKIDFNVNGNVDKNASAKSKILTKLPHSSIICGMPKAEQKDDEDSVNVIDIEFSDLDLEKEFKTESGHNSLKNEIPRIQPLNNSNMSKDNSAKKLVNRDSGVDTKSTKEPIKSMKPGSPKKIQSTTPLKKLQSCIKKEQSTLLIKAVIPKKNWTNIQAKDDNALSASNSLSPVKKVTTEKTSPAHILGLSFIIGIKGESKDGKPNFDCVLCNEKSTTFNGATMHTHVKSRRHVLNAMEVQNYSLFKKYKNDINTTADELLLIMIDYEKSQKKQHLAVATPQNYVIARKNLCENIKNIKESISKKIEKEASLYKKKSDIIKKQDNLKEIAKQGVINVKRIYKEELHELANLQLKRVPQNIVLILDEREEPIKNMPQRGTNFFTLYDPLINFNNAFGKMQKHAYFNKGTAFVFLGETFEFLNKIDLPDCSVNSCLDPVKIVDTSVSNHIEQAITLHKNLLKNTENDILLFTGLMPVHIFAYNTSAVNKRPCLQIHDGDIPRSSSNKFATEAYTVMLSNFNAFVEEHSKVIEFSKFDYELAYFQCPVNERKNNFFARDGFTYLASTLKDRQITTLNYIKGLLRKLEQRRRKLEHLKIKSHDKPSGNLKEKVKEQSNGKAMEACRDRASKSQEGSIERTYRSHDKTDRHKEKSNSISSYSKERAGRAHENFKERTKETKIPLIGETPIVGKLPQPNGSKYEKVVILANNLYEPLLKELQSERVIVMAEEDLSCSQLKSYFLRKKVLMPSNTLWLSATGIFSIANCETTRTCLKENCYFPLRSLVPCNDMQTVQGAAKVIRELADVMTETIKEIKTVMSTDSDFMIIPPIPVSIINESSGIHLELHSLVQKHPNYFIGTESDISHINVVYKVLCKEISSASLRECHLPYNSAHACLHSDFSIEVVDISNFKDKRRSFHVWKETIMNFISDALSIHIPSFTDSNKVEDMDIEEEGDFMSSRIVFFDDCKNIDDKKHSFESKRSGTFPEYSSNKAICNKKILFNKIVFIGSENVLKHAVKLCEKFCSSIPPINFFEIKNPVYWAEFINKCKEWKSTGDRILFIFVPDISMIANDVKDSQCSRWKCKNYLTPRCLSMVGKNVIVFQSLVNGIMDLCLNKSKIILTPIFPRACIQKTLHEDRPAHLQIHKAMIHKSKPLLLEGARSKWIDASDSLEKSWNISNSKIEAGNYGVKDILTLIQDQKKINPIEWKHPDASSMDCASIFEGKWREFLEDAIEVSLKIKKMVKKSKLKDLSSDEIHVKCDNRQTQIVDRGIRYPAEQKALLGNKCLFSRNKIPSLMSLTSSDLSQPPILQDPVPFLPPSASKIPHTNSFHQGVVSSTRLSQPSSFNDHSQTTSSLIDYNSAVSDNRNFNSGIDVTPSYGNFIDASHGINNIASSSNVLPSPVNKDRPSLLPDPPGFEKYSSVRQSVDKASEQFPYRNEEVSQKSSTTPFLDIGSNLNYEDFLGSLANVCDSFSHPPVFERVVFVGKKEIVDPLLKINVESSAIYHNLANIEESDTQGVLLKLGKISPRTLCCLVFGLSVITKAQPISSACSNFNCRQPIPITILKSFNKKGLDLHNVSQGDVISNRLQSVISFIKCISKYIPVIVLPLYPSRIYCDNGINLASHNISHALQGQDNYVVSGNNIIWNQYFMSLTYIWNNLLEDNHKEFQSSLLIAKYIERQPTFFVVGETINDFYTHCAEPTVWKTFSEAVLQSLVLLKSLDTTKSASFRELGQEMAMGPLDRAPKRKSRFSDIEKNPNLPATVKIWNLSDCIPHTFFSDLFKAVDASAQVAANKDNYVVEFGKRNGAELLACKLNGCQIGNTTLKAGIIGEEGVALKLNKIQDTFITSIFNQIYAKWKYLMVETIKKKMNSVVDVTNFKTNKCIGNCVGIEKCINYHNAGDKRRNPLQCKYCQKMCMRPRNPLGYCNLGDSCEFSHNIYEQMFFPTNFQTILCPSNSPSSQCMKKPVCKFAHIDSPEMFYNSVCEDVVVFGTHNTIEYFAGAIRGLSKISLNKGVYKVVLISPSTEFLDVAEKVVSVVMKNHRVKATTLTDRWMNLESYQVLLGTPAALASSQNQIFTAKTGGALIVDDVKRIIGKNPDGDVIHKFIHKIKVATAAANNVNKVFVSSLYDDTITGVLSRFFGLTLKEVRQPESVKDGGVPPLITLGDSPPRQRSSRKAKSPLQVRPFSPPRKNQSPSCESNRGKKRPERSQDRRSRSRSRAKKFKDRTNSPSSKQPKKSVTEFHAGSVVASDSKNLHQMAKQNTTLLDSDNENLRIRLGSQLYESFSKEEITEKDKFEEEYKVYNDVSELHPDYELYFEDFISKYNLKHKYKGEKHKESLWLQFWKVKFPEIKQADWELVRKELVKSYEAKIFQQKSSFSSHSTREAEKLKFDSDTFSMENALNLLEGFCDKIGMLGPALQAMIKSSRDLGINTKKALEVFTNSENKLLINMVLNKLRNMLLESPRNVVSTFQKALDWTEQLLEVAEKGSEKKVVPLNLNAIAKASIGKDSGYIVELIKTALAYEGNSFPSKETVNELFLKVCSIHFNMAMQ